MADNQCLSFNQVFSSADVLEINAYLDRKAREYKPVVLTPEEKFEDYALELEKEWQIFTPHYNTTDLVAIFGRSELDAMCREKIIELWANNKVLRRAYRRSALTINKEVNGENERTFLGIWLDTTLGKKVSVVERQLKRFSLLYRTLHEEKTPSNRLTEDQIQRAREYPTHELYDGRLRHIRNRYSGSCPFHSEKTPSFVIYDDGSFHCFGCGAHGGNAIDYLMKKENLEFRRAVERLC